MATAADERRIDYLPSTHRSPSTTMSAWPWMKGIEVPVMAPAIAPLNEYDLRPAVADLIDQHSQRIFEIRRSLLQHKLYSSKKHDDLWILRFFLSHKKVKPAIAAAICTLEFRDKHKLDETDIRDQAPTTQSTNKALQKYMSCCQNGACVNTLPDDKRGVITFFVLAEMDQHRMVEIMTKEEWLPCFIHITEWSHQWLDYVTRTTGRLTKTVRFGDLTGISLSGMNREATRRDGAAMTVMEDCYPQLLETLFICNPPSWIQIPWRIMRPLMLKRVITKFDFINPAKNEKERKRLYHHISEEQLPVRFGGKRTEWPVPPRG